MNKFILAILLSLNLFNINAIAQNAQKAMTDAQKSAYVDFQTNADIIRLNHLVYWGKLIDEYRQKMGYYPFANQSKHPIYVEIATPLQQSFFNGNKPPAPATIKSMKDFVQELEKGLGRTVDEYYDPQYAPDGKPNFYIYMIDGQDYHLAVHNFSPFSFARHIDVNYHKVEISNIKNRTLNITTLQELLNNNAFKKAMNKPIDKIGFFNQREQKNLHSTKE